MKFSEYILSEGRKEDLLNKHMGNFDVQVLDTILNDPFTQSTNYKYADWILRNLEFNSTPLALEVLEIVKNFDRIGKNLEIKDINQYPDVVELKHAIENYESKSQEKKIEGEAKKIYEDDRVLIVKPLSHRASCKYGKGTKWCTTQESPGYYDKYTSGGQSLYYVMMKEFDISNKFYKIALHKTQRDETWYDAQDVPLPPREVDILKVGLGKRAIKSIDDDFDVVKEEILEKLFNRKNNVTIVLDDNFADTGKKLTINFRDAQIVDLRAKLADMAFEIKLGEETLDMGAIFITFRFVAHDSIGFEADLHPDDAFEAPVDISNLYNNSIIQNNFNLFENGESSFGIFCHVIASRMYTYLKNNAKLVEYVTNKKTWYPNRHSYGFTFEKGGLINQLVDWLNSGKEGTAIDFLIEVGKMERRTKEDGSIFYISGTTGKRIQPKGYFSAFFASAINAGILSYKRKGRKFILAKGPNFESFEKGELKAL